MVEEHVGAPLRFIADSLRIGVCLILREPHLVDLVEAPVAACSAPNTLLVYALQDELSIIRKQVLRKVKMRNETSKEKKGIM